MASKQYQPISEVSAHRDTRIPTEFPHPSIFTMDDPDVQTLQVEVLGAYIDDKSQWKVDLAIGGSRKIFTGGLRISTDPPHRLFVRFKFMGGDTDLYLE